MNVLSLFDGISCGYLALQRAGIKIDTYCALEIDLYAKTISQNNFPDIIRLGDVTNLKVDDLPATGLCIGGPPCQSLSSAGNGQGFEGKSGLFYEYLRILNDLKKKNPKLLFLMENVAMRKEWENIITDTLGVPPIKINSSLVSGQMRQRLYWTNIPYSGPPEDKGIKLQDILENGYVDRDKSYCIDANYYKGGNLKAYFEKSRRQLVFEDKESFLRAQAGDTSVPTRKLTPVEVERLQTLPDNYTAAVSNTQRYKCVGNAWTVDVIAHLFSGIK